MSLTRTTLGVAAMAMALVAVATAAPPVTGTSTNTLTSDVVLGARPAGPNIVVTEEILTASLAGAFTGTSTFTIHGVLHADGSGQFAGPGTFSGTIAGCGSVTVNFQLQFTIAASGQISGTSRSVGTSPVNYVSTFHGSLASPTFTEVSKYVC